MNAFVLIFLIGVMVVICNGELMPVSFDPKSPLVRDYAKQNRNFTRGFVLRIQNRCYFNDTLDEYISGLSYPIYLLDYDGSDVLIRDTITVIITVNIYEFSDLKYFVHKLLKTKSFNNLARIRLMLCDGRLNLLVMSRYMWKHRLINYVFVFIDYDGLKVVSYNPFLDMLRENSLEGIREEFTDILSNMHGYPLRILVLANMIPMNDLLEPKLNFDKSLLSSLGRFVNATIETVTIANDVDVLGVGRSVLRYNTTFCSKTTVLRTVDIPERLREVVGWSYPHTCNPIVVLVPHLEDVDEFSLKLIAILLHFCYGTMLSCVMASLNGILTSSREAFSEQVMHYLAVLYRNNVGASSNSRKTFIFTGWLLFSLVMGAITEVGFLQQMLTSSSSIYINTLQELFASDIPIATYIRFNFTNEHVLSKRKWIQKILTNEGTEAFIGPFYEIQLFVKYFAYTKKQFKYRVMEEVVSPTMGAYVARRQSPYLAKINSLQVKVKEWGVSNPDPIETKKIILRSSAVTFESIRFIFVVYLIGCGMSVSAFLSELLYQRWYKERWIRSKVGKHVLVELYKSSFFENFGKIRFLLCESQFDLIKASREAWLFGLLDYVFVFETDQYQLASYNPFYDRLTVRNLTDVSEEDEFPNMLSNINGYPLRLMTLPDVSYIASGLRIKTSFDRVVKSSLRKYFNATVVKIAVKDNLDTFGIRRHLALTKSDFCIQTTIMRRFNIPRDLQRTTIYSSPHTTDPLVFLVPKYYQIKDFDVRLLLLHHSVIICVAFIVAYLDTLLRLNKKKTSTNFLYYVAVLYRNSLGNTHLRKSFVLAGWMIFSVVMGVITEANILQQILTSTTSSTINTVKDLAASNLSVITYVRFNVCNEVVLSKTHWAERILENKGTEAFVGSFYEMQLFINFYANLKIKFNYRIMDEYLLNTMGVYVVKRRSPYLDRINMLQIRVKEWGIKNPDPLKTHKITLKNTIVTFQKLKMLFCSYVSGAFVSCIAFMAELFLKGGNQGKK
ncbi:hypothetical protein GWI33_019463 [Rhynchophorus ferrugineus]|uniref:Uncharacterized protein n=1 Tax=Rhynchophorus ferrugineus TaxID=354439 RepID=A0A834HRB7_RHYFE|nr:hypothetical protein GWI33_019463 [Rhynchophorus ferrugineus]